MDRGLMFLVRRALTVRNPNQTFSLRCFCSPPMSLSPPFNGKLFVGGAFCSLTFSQLSYEIMLSRETLGCLIFIDLGVIGLSWSVDEKSLQDAFSSFGEVTEVKILYDKDSGRSRGFGFVCFTNQADATCAKDAMDGKALLGRPLRISYALEKVRGAPVVVPRLSSNGDATSLKR
ncbi:hypothetical protein EUGRSUZ_A01097 [Eucalyptus grandis]|uniref:Uncharacterized protein n=2 Tax=Eucalyptus grandis TaxID=71139 RepID=A0ACC3M4R5_EUCGR|nr:hypothetical protein EUGRSUZ_A01097 [Eucalyptus grandis]